MLTRGGAGRGAHRLGEGEGCKGTRSAVFVNLKLFQKFKNDLSYESISLSFLFFLKSTKMVSYTLHAPSPERTQLPGPQAYFLPLAEVTGAGSVPGRTAPSRQRPSEAEQ